MFTTGSSTARKTAPGTPQVDRSSFAARTPVPNTPIRNLDSTFRMLDIDSNDTFTLGEDPDRIFARLDPNVSLVLDVVANPASQKNFLELVMSGTDVGNLELCRFEAGIQTGIKMAKNLESDCTKNIELRTQLLGRTKELREGAFEDAMKIKVQVTNIGRHGEKSFDLTIDMLTLLLKKNNVLQIMTRHLSTLAEMFYCKNFEMIQLLKKEEKYALLVFSNDIGLYFHRETHDCIVKAKSTGLVYHDFPEDQIIVSRKDSDDALAGLIALYYDCLPEWIIKGYCLQNESGKREWMNRAPAGAPAMAPVMDSAMAHNPAQV